MAHDGTSAARDRGNNDRLLSSTAPSILDLKLFKADFSQITT